MNWVEITLLVLGYIWLIFNMIVICLSFKRDFPVITTRLTIFASGIILAVSIYSVDRLINHAKLLDRANAINIIGFVFWLLYLVLASILVIIHLVRILGGKKYANNRSFYR